ncbi:MAG TPA: penicillin-binding protein 2 [Clostridia bacterium]|nr:penicillin-binding protein 2 [Clostridia bacterium]
MSAKRNYIISGIILSLFAAVLARFAYIQFISYGELSESAFQQRLSNTQIEKMRGNITDRNGIPFTNRERSYTAFIKTAFMPKTPGEREKVCSALGITDGALSKLTGKSKPLLIETDVAGSNAVKNLNTNWVTILNSLKRYGVGSIAKHVVGYLSKKDRIGQSGIEKAYENEIRDNSVYEIGTVTDAAKNPIKGLGYRIKDLSSDKKRNVRLTLDYHIQKIVEDAMNKNGISGAAVVEDVVTGDILAMASRPDYDQNAVENYLDSSGKELFNKATAAYNLGSVFKIIDAAAFFEDPGIVLDDGAASMIGSDPGLTSAKSHFIDNGHYFCEGAVNINGLTFKCSSYYEGGHGLLNMEQAFAVSCNSYFIELCQKIGYRELIDMARRFGLGSQTGISGQGIAEAAGTLPKSDSYYSQADIANLAIGQGALLATPLQVADMVATVANGGIKNRINIVDSITDDDGKVVREVRIKEGQRVISAYTASRIKNLMEAVTQYGTGTDAAAGLYGGAGGKTGSAETGITGKVHAWFAGYFPINGPRYSIAVFVENGQLGGKAAAPVFADIAREMAKKGY